jgi:molybdate/tungstate transport system ATP-binding protein
MIEVKALARQWGAFQLGEMSLTVESGEHFAVLGPCGCGKTLLLETIAGLHQPHDGDVSINAHSVAHLPPEKRHIGMVYQELYLFPNLSVRANIAYGLRYRRLSRSAIATRVDEMLALLKIEHLAGRPSPVGLSGGESQKVALARALAVEPEVLLLDEPLASLDYISSQHISSILRDINQSLGVTILHVTHDYQEAAALAQRIAVMDAGKIVQVGKVNEIFWRPECRFVAEFLGIQNVLPCHITRRTDEVDLVRLGAQELTLAATGLNGDALCTVRPEDITVQADGSALGDNTIRAIVREVRDAGFSVRLLCLADDLPIATIVSRARFRSLRCTVGDSVWLELPREAVHVFAEGT